MIERDWYTYHDQKQTGPIELSAIQGLYYAHELPDEAFVFRTGWKDWRLVADCLNELEVIAGGPPPPPTELKELRKRAPRATVSGKVIIHGRDKLEIGKGVNISPSGIFIETDLDLFKVGELVNITCKLKNFENYFRAKVTIIRISKTPRGYGMRFEKLDKKITAEIQNLIAIENTNLTSSQRGSYHA